LDAIAPASWPAGSAVAQAVSQLATRRNHAHELRGARSRPEAEKNIHK
jgi:hypothetical protein